LIFEYFAKVAPPAGPIVSTTLAVVTIVPDFVFAATGALEPHADTAITMAAAATSMAIFFTGISDHKPLGRVDSADAADGGSEHVYCSRELAEGRRPM
jgi:hypothetical protein